MVTPSAPSPGDWRATRTRSVTAHPEARGCCCRDSSYSRSPFFSAPSRRWAVTQRQPYRLPCREPFQGALSVVERRSPTHPRPCHPTRCTRGRLSLPRPSAGGGGSLSREAILQNRIAILLATPIAARGDQGKPGQAVRREPAHKRMGAQPVVRRTIGQPRQGSILAGSHQPTLPSSGVRTGPVRTPATGPGGEQRWGPRCSLFALPDRCQRRRGRFPSRGTRQGESSLRPLQHGVVTCTSTRLVCAVLCGQSNQERSYTWPLEVGCEGMMRWRLGAT
jgi:hypothetical protein